MGAPLRVLQWLQHGFRLPWVRGPPPRFHEGESCTSATPDEQAFLAKETARLTSLGAWEDTTDDRFVSKVFLVPKPGHFE